MQTEKVLAVIGSNPATTSGVRTTNRAQKACSILGFDGYALSNLIDTATYRTGELSMAGAERDQWVRSRPALMDALSAAAGVLLAYGIEKPSGTARAHRAEQIAWLNSAISDRGLPVWAVGGQPRHPSRWQRYTFRQHPDVEFTEALALSLIRVEI